MLWDTLLEDRVRLAVTARTGGGSTGPYDGLNLGGHVGDEPATVEGNRLHLARGLGVPRDRLLFLDQVHGSRVVEVDGPWTGPAPSADAMVTRTPGLALAVLVADCVPVLLADPEAGVVGVAHAGRPGMHAEVAVRAAEAMRDLGARRIRAVLGPSVCPRCYPVPLEMREEVAARRPEARSVTWRAEPSIDVAAGVLAQLAPLCESVEQLPGCTVERADLYSYRRDGVTGRFAGVALIQAAA